jgi:hypothetical protein
MDHPVIEFRAPISQSRRQLFVGEPLLAFLHQFRTVSDSAVYTRTNASGEKTPLSPVAGNLLFQAAAEGARHDTESQRATIKEAVQYLPGSDYLNVLNLILNDADAKASRGLVLDQ